MPLLSRDRMGQYRWSPSWVLTMEQDMGPQDHPL